MPKIGGRELAQQLTQLRPEMKVIYMSGYTEDTILRQGILETEVAFLQKPTSMDKMLRKIFEVLGK